jgi:peptide/nickel transport system substrate-binding protein
MAGDWAKGPAGTNELGFIYGADERLTSKSGSLVESWKIIEPGRMTFKIRSGVHFGLNPNSEASRLVNGRELTAEDVAFTFNRLMKENTHTRPAAPDMVANTTVTVIDKYTIEIKTLVKEAIWVFSDLVFTAVPTAPEVVQKYGDLSDWKNSVGVGPYMLTDFVSGSALTFVKNPNFWGKDPVGPGKGNQLPYLDGVKVLILPDPSTRLAALRTGKIDWMGGNPPLVKDDYDSLMSDSPKLLSKRYLANGTNLVYMRVDKPEQPFKDVRVRQALTMAIDYKSIVDKLMDADAEYPGFPTMSAPDFKSVYFPLSEASKTVQDMYTYNPAKAKELLAQAGYPNGFNTTVLANATGGINIDQLAVFKEYWSKIGVNLTINPMENAAYAAASQALAYDQMLYGGSGSHGVYVLVLNFDGGTQWNGSQVNDPTAKKARADVATAYAAGDQAKADALYKDFEKYAMEQAWMIPYPRAYNYTVWHPWLKNYKGELNVGDDTGFSWTRWVWLDQNLKKSMGY